MGDALPSIYKPLSVDKKEIRILTLLPDLKDGLVSCTLETLSLNAQDCTYDAVSWCWGDATQQKPVIVDGHIVRIPGNADEVLRKVAIRHGHIRVWIDAICINQSDLEERASQVSIMRQVYSRATKVLIWIGEDEGFGARAIKSVEMIVQHCRESTNDFVDYESRTWMRSGKRTPHRWFSYDTLPDGVDWPAIRHLYSSPLLCRVWVIQEIALAKDPVCFYGHHFFTWKQVGIAAEWMIHRSYERSQYCGVFVRGIMNGSIISSSKRGGRDMDRLLMTSVHFDCSEPRDKVFGLLGLTEKFEIVKPNYEEDVQSIFIHATRAAISSSQRLHTLRSAQIGRSREGHGEVPSWVPPYAAKWREGPKSIRNFSEKGADNDSPLMWDPSSSDEVLRVKGITLSEIVAVFGPLDAEILSSMDLVASLVNDMRDLVATLNPEASTSGVLYGAFTTHQANDVFGHGHRHVDPGHFETFLNDCRRSDATLPSNGIIPSTSTVLFDHLRIDALHRCFFVTKDGQAGQSSSVPAVGDVVCILFGSEVPLILRPVGGKHKLVGGAHLGDLMDVRSSSSLVE